MNRRQEIAAWVLALIVAGPKIIDAFDGYWTGFDAMKALFFPAAFLGPLIVYSLRDRTVSPPPLPGHRELALLLVMGGVVVAQVIDDRLGSIEYSVDQAQNAAESAAEAARR